MAINFPHWVKESKCETRSRSFTGTYGKHGVEKRIVKIPVNQQTKNVKKKK